MEEWRPVPRFESLYEVSSIGRVRSLRSGRLLKPHLGRGGYPTFDVFLGGERLARIRVHHAVLEVFVGPRPDGFECRHINGRPDDNRVENLCWAEHQANMDDQYAHGTRRVGENHYNARFSTADLQRAAELRRAGQSTAEIADAMKIHRGYLQQIFDGKRRQWDGPKLNQEAAS